MEPSQEHLPIEVLRRRSWIFEQMEQFVPFVQAALVFRQEEVRIGIAVVAVDDLPNEVEAADAVCGMVMKGEDQQAVARLLCEEEDLQWQTLSGV